MDKVPQNESLPNLPIDLSERMLLHRHAGGDPLAFPLFMKAFQLPVYSYLVRSGVPATVRDDLFQDIFMRIHAAAHTYHPTRPLKPWLFTVVANVVRTHFRKKRVEELVFPDDFPDLKPSSHAQIVAVETAEMLDRTLQTMSLEQKEVIILHCLEGLSLNEVSGVLKLPLGTIKTHLHRGRKILTESLVRQKQRRSNS